MGLLHHRKLIKEICELICHGKQYFPCSSEADCKVCFKICLTNPQPSPTPPPPQVPSSFYLDENEDQGNHQKLSNYLILALALLATVFFFICCRAIYTKLRSRRIRRVLLSSPTQQTEETRDDFLDEEHGPMVFHPIWYIRTLGLNRSVIKAITVCKYKKGEGLIEGTECSVCLSEFQEGESLRLLPKCHHAFHLPCIDTWLNSHTNCPMCRAPIVTNPSTARVPSLESIVVDSSSSLEHTQMEVLENSGETLENRGSDSELRNGAEEEEQLEVEDGRRACEAETETETQVGNNSLVSIRPRRSVSLDDTLVANINLAFATILSTESNGNSNRVIGSTSINSKGSSSFRSPRYLQGVPSPMKRSSSHSGKYFLSWYSRSQKKKPNAILRSL